jgi:hypothetical protein
MASLEFFCLFATLTANEQMIFLPNQKKGPELFQAPALCFHA